MHRCRKNRLAIGYINIEDLKIGFPGEIDSQHAKALFKESLFKEWTECK
jgi:hypothetical protein